MQTNSSAQTSSETFAEDNELTAVLAHSMLGTARATGGAIALAIADEPDAMGRDSLLRLAMTRLEFLTAQLRDLAYRHFWKPRADSRPRASPRRSDRRDGTPVELYSAFDRTWSAGFEIASAAKIGYRIRRRSDGPLLAGFTSRSDLRELETREARKP